MLKNYLKKLLSKDLTNNGERVDINLKTNSYRFDDFDMYQKSHFNRYEFCVSSIDHGEVVGDFACGTGYGSIMLSQKASQVISADLDSDLILEIGKRYKNYNNVKFICTDILLLEYEDYFNTIVSFETIEHFIESDIIKLLNKYRIAVKKGGKLIFSTPYLQAKSKQAIQMGFHKTFNIDEHVIKTWLSQSGFMLDKFFYQNYKSHIIKESLDEKDFIICVAVIP
jgi:2-polyprenyl-3-methyl-5-hydroxy-6-metoxy-1,4-benzoquinol methylase